MAQGKNSFILYLDQRGIFDKLPDDEAGKLIKHIFSYVNDEAPEGEFVTELAFEAIKQALKRDLKKWERQQEQRKEAGRRSAESRKRKSTTVNERSISSTVNVSDNVNVNASVNGNENVNVDIIYPFEGDLFLDAWKKWKEYKKIEHKFSYKSPISENTALKKLFKLAQGDEQRALMIMEQAVENGWKGFYDLPKEQNQSANDDTEYLQELKQRLNGGIS